MLKWIIRVVLVMIGFVLVVIMLLGAFAFFPVGSPVANHETNSQEFNWGSMYVWLSTWSVSVSENSKNTGRLHLQFSLENNVIDKGCTVTVKRVFLNDPDTGVVLIDDITNKMVKLETEKGPVWSDGRLQLSLPEFQFEYVRSAFPYDLNIDLDLNCRDVQSSHRFARQLEFSMVQPRVWEQ